MSLYYCPRCDMYHDNDEWPCVEVEEELVCEYSAINDGIDCIDEYKKYEDSKEV